MMNQAMQRKLSTRDAVDVSACERTSDGDYVITNFVDDVDYCNADSEEWIWSIGRRKSDGAVLASTSSKFYQNPEFECLWLR